MTTVAILGQGNMGAGLARRLEGKVTLKRGARQPQAGQLSYADAAAGADIVVLALPYDASLAAIKSLNLNGKIVVDMTNPVKADFSGLTLGHTTSAAEELQQAAPGAKVVKAFNTIFAGLFGTAPAQTAEVPVFVAGNDEVAVDAVAGLATAAGFAVEKTGGLDGARLLEPVGMLNIRLGYGLGHGTAIAPSWKRLAA
jgi:8-hydroxy-5-deazaflavin:NADPH oxidoreductase